MDQVFLLEARVLTVGPDNPRGNLSQLHVPGSLWRACDELNRSDCAVLVLTGFPCIVTGPVHQETDGIAGAIAIARSIGPDRAVIVIEEACVSLVRAALDSLTGGSRFRIYGLPTGCDGLPDSTVLQDIWALGPYTLVCIERASPSEDGTIRTMRGRDISALCAPECVISEIWRRSERPIIAIGDGGNELGLGTVSDATRKHIPLGEVIACAKRFSADVCIIADVSNVGGYALSVGIHALMRKTAASTASVAPDPHSERSIAMALQQSGVKDGVTQEASLSVDGVDIEVHIQTLSELLRIACVTAKRPSAHRIVPAAEVPHLVAPFSSTRARRGTFDSPLPLDADAQDVVSSKLAARPHAKPQSFLCEGRLIVEAAIRAHLGGRLRLQVILGEEVALRNMLSESELGGDSGVSIVMASQAILTELVGFSFHRGIVACAAVPPSPPPSALLPLAKIIVLPSIGDATNFGLLLRSAACLGVDGVIYGNGPEVFDQRVVRVSMGCCWSVPVWCCGSSSRALELLKQWRAHDAGSRVVAAAITKDSISSRDWHPTRRSALVLGPEHPGLSAEWLSASDTTVCIPMQPGLDSLNVAAAGSILMYTLTSSK